MSINKKVNKKGRNCQPKRTNVLLSSSSVLVFIKAELFYSHQTKQNHAHSGFRKLYNIYLKYCDANYPVVEKSIL